MLTKGGKFGLFKKVWWFFKNGHPKKCPKLKIYSSVL
jgi:hypothetical protein